MKRREDGKRKRAKRNHHCEKNDQPQPQPASTYRVKSRMEVAIYVIGAMCLIASIVAALFGSLGHRDLLIWTSCIAVCLAVVAGFCWLQDFHRKKDHGSIPPPKTHDDRPFLWVKGVEAHLDDPTRKEGNPILEIVVENTSDVPAFNAIADTSILWVQERLTTSPKVLHAVPSRLTPAVIPAKSVRVQTLPDLDTPFDETLIPLIQEGKIFLYVHTELRYESMPGQKVYTCRFSALYDPKRKNFFLTPFDNECE